MKRLSRFLATVLCLLSLVGGSLFSAPSAEAATTNYDLTTITPPVMQESSIPFGNYTITGSDGTSNYLNADQTGVYWVDSSGINSSSQVGTINIAAAKNGYVFKPLSVTLVFSPDALSYTVDVTYDNSATVDEYTLKNTDANPGGPATTVVINGMTFEQETIQLTNPVSSHAFHVKITDDQGNGVGNDIGLVGFETDGEPTGPASAAPTAVTNAPSSITSSSATVNGTVNDNGASTTVSFDYGTTSSYGSNVAASTGGTVAAGSGSTPVSATLTGLQPNTTYHYRVVATSSAGTTKGSDQTFTTSSVPVADFSTTGKTGSTASFSWTAASGATNIVIEQSPAGSNTWTTATTGTINPADTTATVTGLSVATAYDFRLVVTGGTNAGNSNTVSVTTDTIPTTDFANTSKTATSATFSWTAANGATSLAIEQSPHGANTWTTATTGTINPTDAAATVTGLSVATAYDFRLVVTGGPNAGNSNTVSVTTNSSSITNFTSSSNTATTATFSWTAASGATGIVIEQSPHGANTWTTATTGTINPTDTTATVTGLSAATAYDFRLVVTGGPNAGNSNTVSVTTKSSNADLSELTLSSGTLSPAFASGTTTYTASVANSVTSVDVTPTVEDSNATLTVNGTAATSGSASTVALNVGSNTITVVVTAQDGTTTNTYTITVTRAPSSNADLSELTLSSGTLSPAFSSGTKTYTASVSNSVTSVDVTPTVADSNATVTVDGNGATSGSASNVALNVGSNTITVVVTAQDGTTTKTYTITVTRAPSSNADLSKVTLSSGTLSPAFASGTTSYTASVSNSVTSVDVTPTVEDSNATLTMNGTATTSGSASNVALNVGPNTITVVVTAQDGTTTKTYTITVTRAPSSNADLSKLTLSSGTLSPAFASGTTTYTASVSNSVTSVDVTPTVEDSNATLTVNGTAATSGSASTVALNVGSNTITVVVTAQDGTTTNTYTITVTRTPSSNADLSELTFSSGTLSPAFASGTTSYTASVANRVNSVDVTPTVADSNATLTVNGTAATSGSASTVALNVGSNTITVVVTAQDGTTTKTYTITVTRAPSSNADLSKLTLSSGTLSPAFASGTTSYTASVAYSVTSVDLTPTVADSNATVTVDGNGATSGNASNVALKAGANTITIVVAAQDGTTAQTYTVVINRVSSAPVGISHTDISHDSWTESWSSVSGATGYNIYIDGVKVNTSLLKDTSYDVTGKLAGKTYDVTITAVNNGGESDLSTPDQVTTLPYTVTFNSNGGSAVTNETVGYGHSATVPTAPTKMGYTFVGWYTDSSLLTAYDFTSPVSADTTLYAKWTLNNYTVSFNSNGGSAVTSESVEYGSKATQPTAPTKTGYTFAGWYTDSSLNTAYDFTTTITGYTILYAKWTLNNYNVSFNSNGGSAVTSESVGYGNTATQPTAPTKTGYTFAGWYTDSGLSTAYDFTTPVMTDIALYAKWTQNSTGRAGSTGSQIAITSPPVVQPGQPNQPYRQTLHAMGGIGPYTWSIIDGTLPIGLKMSASGVISGKSHQAKPQILTVQAVDSKGMVQQKEVVVDVVPKNQREMVWQSSSLNAQNVPSVVANEGNVQTTYMPIWYVMEMLKSFGVNSTWNGRVWKMHDDGIDSIGEVSTATNGKYGVYLNGALVEKVNGIVSIDPSSKKKTAYMPIWYVQQIISALGVTNTWDGKTWVIGDVNSSIS